MSTRFTRASSSTKLWQLLEAEAGLDPEDYDTTLVSELRTRLELAPAIPMVDALRLSDISIDHFVNAFLVAAQPYVEMWADMLHLFERAAATAGTHNLDIAYDFGATDGPQELRFSLEHFRRVLEVVYRLTARFDLSKATPSQFWAVSEVFRRLNGNTFVSPGAVDPQVADFVAACHNGPWPSVLPARPNVPNPVFDRLLNEVWALATVVLSDLRAVSADHESLRQSSRAGTNQQRDLASGLTLQNLWITESDYWLPTLIATGVASLRGVEDGPDQQVVTQFENALQPLRNTDPTRTEPRRRLEEFLSLPIWKYRHELYSNWVCTRVVDALDDQEPFIHAARGTIQFLFSGTHLATFDRQRPRLHLWTEFRTPLEDPVGDGRSSAIQPDIALRADPLTAGLVPLVIECKQYKKSGSRKFADALTDYARGHPDATVILVNYGPANASAVHRYVAPDVQTRTAVVGELRPGALTALEEFRWRVRSALRLESPPVAASLPTSVRLRLTWGPTPRDLDLHLGIDAATQRWEVSYRDRGRLDEAPFAQLQNDDTKGNGDEVLLIHRWLHGRYTVEVNNYSGEVPLSKSNAVVSLGLHNGTYEFRCPVDVGTRTWTVCWVDGATGEVTWPDSAQVVVHPTTR